MRRFLTLLMVLSILLVPTLAHAAEQPIRLYVGGGEVKVDVPPVIEGGRTLVPVRALTEALGFKVTWDAATETATLTKESLTIQLTVGKQEALVNGKVVKMDVPAVNRDGRLMVPVRFVSEQLGAKVTWDPDNRVVKVDLPTAEAPSQAPAQPVTPPAQPVTPPAQPEAPKPDAPQPQVDPALQALIEKSQQYENVKATGEFTATVQATGLTMEMKMEMEMYAKGEDSLVYTTMHVFGTTQKVGAATYKGQAWMMDPGTGVWNKSEELAAATDLDNPAAFAKLDKEFLELAKISKAEQTYEGTAYDVITVTLDKAALAKLSQEEMVGVSEMEVQMVVWLQKETAMPHHMDLHMTMNGEGTTMDMAGTLFFEVWDQPIPFPAEIMQ